MAEVAIEEAVAERLRVLIRNREEAERAFQTADAMAHAYLEGLCAGLGQPFPDLLGADPERRVLLFPDTQETPASSSRRPTSAEASAPRAIAGSRGRGG